jgi:hypothetical protein
MFEHKKKPLLPKQTFYLRVLKCLALSFALLVVMLMIGIVGFAWLESYAIEDSLLNAALYISGIGSNYPVETEFGKLFATIYALGCPFISNAAVAIFFLPFLHRFLHKFHLDRKD